MLGSVTALWRLERLFLLGKGGGTSEFPFGEGGVRFWGDGEGEESVCGDCCCKREIVKRS